jgi:hypothetical protein
VIAVAGAHRRIKSATVIPRPQIFNAYDIAGLPVTPIGSAPDGNDGRVELPDALRVEDLSPSRHPAMFCLLHAHGTGLKVPGSLARSTLRAHSDRCFGTNASVEDGSLAAKVATWSVTDP